MEKLFHEFAPVDYETWLKQIQKDLKDKPLENLTSHPESDLEIKAYYHPVKDRYEGAEFSPANHFDRKTNGWAVRAVYASGQNNRILKELNEGIDAVSLPAISEEQVNADSADILFEHIQSDFRIENKEMALKNIYPPSADLNFDVLGLNAQNGRMSYSMDDFFSFYEMHPSNRTIWVSGSLYGDAGATTVQELAFSLCHLNEYFQYLQQTKTDLNSVHSKVCVELSVSSDYFVNIARFRAFRELYQLLCAGHGLQAEGALPKLYARTANTFLAQNDRNNNYLRQTTQAMSAILGGCDVLTIVPLTVTDEEEMERNLRMIRNIQLVLREESYLDKVVDPAAGSMFLESLTDQLISKSWALFQQLEQQGGFIKCLEKNVIQNLIEKNRESMISNVNSGAQIFLGVNKYPNNLESWISVESKSPVDSADFKTISPFSIENYYQPKTTVS